MSAIGNGAQDQREASPRVLDWIDSLHPQPGDVVLMHMAEGANEDDLRALAMQAGALAQRSRASFILLPHGVTVETIDEREMLVRGWLRVGPVAHTTEQLASPPTDGDQPLPSA